MWDFIRTWWNAPEEPEEQPEEEDENNETTCAACGRVEEGSEYAPCDACGSRFANDDDGAACADCGDIVCAKCVSGNKPLIVCKACQQSLD